MKSNPVYSQLQSESDSLSNFVKTALIQNHVSGLVKVLEVITNCAEAYACILWKLEPNIDLNDENIKKDARLFILASFHCKQNENDEEHRRTIPLDFINLIGSANGKAILENKEQIIDDVKNDLNVQQVDWINRDDLTSMIAIPIKSNESDKFPLYTLALYRNEKICPFSPKQLIFLQQVSELILPLYHTLQNRVENSLLDQINNEINKAQNKDVKNFHDLEKISKIDYKEQSSENLERDTESLDLEKMEIKSSLSTICKLIGENFQCVEVSIFLKDEKKGKPVFSLQATTCREWSEDRRNEYSPNEKEGLTAWVLKNKESVHIFDLGNFTEEKLKLVKRNLKYINLTWKDSFNVKKLSRLKLHIPSDQNLPPLNFVAVPIVIQNEVLGVIRCSVATKAPWFFIDRQKLLERVAVQISRFWDKWLQHYNDKRENSEWKRLFSRINDLNNRVQESLINSTLKKDYLYKRVIGITEDIIQVADIVDIMLYDTQRNEIYFADVGKRWSRRVSKPQYEEKKKTSFSLINAPVNSLIKIAADLLDNPSVKIYDSLEKLNIISSVFPDTKKIIIAPIKHEKKPDGLLAIRITQDGSTFTSYAPLMVQLLGQQLGLYLSLFKHDNQQVQAFENLFHQLKGPVELLSVQTQNLLKKVVGEITTEEINDLDEIETELLIIRGLSRKTKTVADNAELFTELATKGKLDISNYNLTKISTNDHNGQYNIVKLLGEFSIDYYQALGKSKNVSFNVIKQSFEVLNKKAVFAETNMIEQCINCLLDNAGKYSFSDTYIDISGSIEKDEEKSFFIISVKSKGIYINADELEKCKERKYRGKNVEGVIGEGAGLGLWVTNQIILAHGGKIDITSNPKTYITEVKLLFPTV